MGTSTVTSTRKEMFDEAGYSAESQGPCCF